MVRVYARARACARVMPKYNTGHGSGINRNKGQTFQTRKTTRAHRYMHALDRACTLETAHMHT